MSQSKIAEWSYYLGCISTLVAIVYRVLGFAGLGAPIFGETPRIVPHNFLDLSILLFVLSIASNGCAIVRREDGKAAAIGR
jgi:hypothetical protein